MLLINTINSMFLFSNLFSTRVRMDESLLSFPTHNYLGMCWVPLCLFFFSLVGWVFSSCLFPVEGGTSFGDKRLNMMNKCLVLSVWPGRIVSVVKITGETFPCMINREPGKNSSLQQGSSVIQGTHFCHLFPTHFTATSLVAVSYQSHFFLHPQASEEQLTLRSMCKIDTHNVCVKSHT